MVYVNSAVNPVLYNLTSSRFRESLFRILGFKKKQSSISRTSSFHHGMTLQMGVVLPIISSSHHLERSCTVPWQTSRSQRPAFSNSLKILDNTSKNRFTSPVQSSPVVPHRTVSSLTLSTQLSSPSFESTRFSRMKRFFGRGAPSASPTPTDPFRSLSLSPTNNHLSVKGKSPFLGRSTAMLPSPSHLSYPYKGEQRRTCKIPTCSRAQNVTSNEEHSVSTNVSSSTQLASEVQVSQNPKNSEERESSV